MLKNEPPPGTRIRFTRAVRKARAYDTAVLGRPLRTYTRDLPGDRFRVTFQGDEILVQRQDIEKAD